MNDFNNKDMNNNEYSWYPTPEYWEKIKNAQIVSIENDSDDDEPYTTIVVMDDFTNDSNNKFENLNEHCVDTTIKYLNKIKHATISDDYENLSY